MNKLSKINSSKIVVVTGASNGIGKAIAIHLAELGYLVHGTYNTSGSQATALSEQFGIIFHQADLSNRHETLKLAKILSPLTLYALINNAGIFEMENLDEFSFDIWDKTLEVNLSAPLILSRILSKSMKKGGSIVNIASTDGFIGAYTGLSYSASKAALINITKSLGNTLGPTDVRINAIAPGWIETGMVDENSAQTAKETNPLERTGEPNEIANVVEFLISEQASYINGATIVVDGGGINVDYGLKKESGY